MPKSISGCRFRFYAFHSFWTSLRIYVHIYIYIWSHPPSGDSSSWGWVHYARQLNSQYDHMFKNTANTNKNYSLNTYDLKYIDISKGKKNNILKTESGFEKGHCFLQIVNTLHEKCTWSFKKLHGKQKKAICVKKICKQHKQYKNTNERMHWVLNFKVHQTCTGTKKTQVLNLKVHQTCTGTKKQKFWTSKCTKPAEGQKNKKSLEG